MFRSDGTIVGVIHLPPLPGFSGSPGVDAIIDKALADLEALEAGPVEGVLVENEYDRPHRVEAGPDTIAVMTRVARAVVEHATRAAVGVEILLNDPEASLAVAHAAGASFLRTDYFVDPMERSEYGAMRIDPQGLLALRENLGAGSVRILADIQVKYARMRVERTLSESARLAREAGADAIVVTGVGTGHAPTTEEVLEAKAGAGATPVLVGSGFGADQVGSLGRAADGAIVGTSLKSGDFVDRAKVRELIDAYRLHR